ncbi:MFS transporter [Lactiplantibacillus plantarum]|uniref:Transport protein, major facilitator superfamily (MFS) n=1 Tax=Lactiplantibacillus plantarum (strain ATCC BAA-793 / NCIMB 8826 / WCFS1) TaxID=220668 RepID=F9UKX4_LACPL|nr:MFS transporter [Lactiplantibacillus plantarum]MDE4414913.1 MFS transporter [Lactiplantibacillus plantarum]MDE4417339.1 MFS transporter [Lactiplantibacillus plantarum]MDE4420796.1 MFS transporter [Lactiplantibacillus plantarum]MDE4423726.1 MFS transporter [Lactiplantibacillus plantarum]MDE4426618.1 MFS transporter [Lactiplantibacillus plantarum]
MNITSLLGRREFRNFFLADIISGFGVGLTTVGANWYMLQSTHSNKLVGMYLTVNVLAGFLMSPLAGSLTDRFSRKQVILWTFLGRALPMSLIALVIGYSGFNLWAMYGLAILTGAGWITYMAASRSYVQAVLPEELLGTANSFIEVSLQVGMFAAGAISGIILNYTGFMIILVINIIMFFVAVLLVAAIKADSPVNKGINEESAGFSNGLEYIWKHKSILSMGIISILPLIVTQLFNVSSPDYVSTVLRANSVVYGFVDMGYGIGGLAAGLITGYLINHFKNKNIIVFFFTLATIGLLTLYWTHVIPLTYVCTFSLGLSNSALRVVINTVLMHRVDKKFMGRATSIWNGTAQLIEVFASTLMGVANDKFGANIGFLWMAVIMLIGAVWSFIMLNTTKLRSKQV